MEVTGHNIANVNTTGYSQQRVNLVTNEPISNAPGQLGMGVNALEIERVYSRYVGDQLGAELQTLGWWEAQQGALETVELLFSGYGLNEALGEFFNAWEDLANNPEGQAERVVVRSRGEQVVDLFRRVYSELEKIQQGAAVDTSISGTVADINQIIGEIADLNQKIYQVEVTGQNANDFRDRRDLLVNELSGLVDINSFEDDKGMITVTLGSGRTLADKNNFWELDTQIDSTGIRDIVWVDSAGNGTSITTEITNGKLGGWIGVRDGDIQDYIDRLDTVAGNLISEVNQLHQNGYGLSTDPATLQPYTGIDYFNGTSASDMAVNTDIINDVNKIAAAGTAVGVPGDSSNAIAIAYLRDASSIGELYTAIVSDVGTAVQQASGTMEQQKEVVSQLEYFRESISGVSLDEQMVNLIRFQHAYEAAAKLVSTTDELLQTLINM